MVPPLHTLELDFVCIRVDIPHADQRVFACQRGMHVANSHFHQQVRMACLIRVLLSLLLSLLALLVQKYKYWHLRNCVQAAQWQFNRRGKENSLVRIFIYYMYILCIRIYYIYTHIYRLYMYILYIYYPYNKYYLSCRQWINYGLQRAFQKWKAHWYEKEMRVMSKLTGMYVWCLYFFF